MAGQLNSSLFKRTIVSVKRYPSEWSVLNKSRVRMSVDVTLSCGHTVCGIRSGAIHDGQRVFYCPVCCAEYDGRIATIGRGHRRCKNVVHHYVTARMLDGTVARGSFATIAEADAWIAAGCPERARKRKEYTHRERPESGMWEYHKPHADRCCICGDRLTASVAEDRPTGWDVAEREPKNQTWYYCPSCWERHCRICGTAEPTAIAV